MNANAAQRNVFVFRKGYFEDKISTEIASYDLEENEGHRQVLKTASEEFRKTVERLMPGTKVFATGSFACGVDIHSSDLDFTLEFKRSDGKKDERQPIEKLTALRNAFMMQRWGNYKVVKLIAGKNNLLQLHDVVRKVDIDVTVDNDTSKRNTAILRWYGQIDSRFPTLCKAVKDWASHTGIENSKDGRVNSFSICLMLINYLQVGVSPAVLPCLQKELPELNGEIQMENDDYGSWSIKERLAAKGVKLGENTSSVGILFAGFIEYYGSFDFKTKWISVRRGAVLDKWVNEEERMEGCPEVCHQVTVEDPFLIEPRNCAGTLLCDTVMDRFQKSFKLCAKKLNEYGTIFIDRPSPSKLRLTKEGKERDLQKTVWMMEEKLSFNNNSWGMTDGKPFFPTYEMFEGKRPEVFWKTVDKDEKNEGIVMPSRLKEDEIIDWSIVISGKFQEDQTLM